jgi:hypothetical protein
MRDHLVMFGSAGLDDLIFTGEHGQPLRRSNFNKTTSWKTAVTAVGLPPGFRFHDLRHTGNTLAAETGASTRELMERMGHDSSHAALICQHGSARRYRAIADALDSLIEKERTRDNDVGEKPTGTQRARGGPIERTLMRPSAGIMSLAWAFGLERVTRIELALSAWESALGFTSPTCGCAGPGELPLSSRQSP